MSYFKVNDNCNGCLACIENCPASALDFIDQEGRRTLKHNMTKCARCGQCWRVCPQRAIEFETLLHGAWNDVITLELLRCSECGEALYSADFGRTVQEKLNAQIRPLCPRHQEEHARLAAAYPGGPTDSLDKI